MSNPALAAAELLAATSQRGDVIDQLPEALRPTSEAEAFAVQSAFIRRYGSVGWKVGPHPAREGWCGAPLRGAAVLPSGHQISRETAARLRVEVEVAVVLGADLPAKAGRAEVTAAIAGTYLAFELFRSSYADPGQQDFPSLLADNLSNSGIVLSARALSHGDSDLAALRIDMARDGEAQASVERGASLEAIVEGIQWLAGYAAELGSGLRRDHVILTGARIGPLSVAAPGTYRASCATSDVVLQVGSKSASTPAG